MKYLLLDTNIVVDYLKADKTLFSLVSQYVGEVFYADAMAAEIKQLEGRAAYEEIGIRLAPVDPSDISEAKNRKLRGALSEYDWICFFTAKRLGYCCVTNDGDLRKQCEKEGVETIRGGKLIIELCRNGGVTKDRAKEIGRDIKNGNPWITDAWLAAFIAKIDKL